MEVKICGVCRPEDAELAGTAGAAYVGVILAPGHLRTRTVPEAAAIFAATSCRRVGVFVDATSDEVVAVATRLRLDAVQLHGDETPAAVSRVAAAGDWEVWKAVRLQTGADLAGAAARYADGADALLLDGWAAHAHGGTGATFDWRAVAPVRDALPPDLRLIVAGGLTPLNVADAVTVLRPAIVDVSSGVEDTLGRKSVERVHAFIAAARGSKGLP